MSRLVKQVTDHLEQVSANLETIRHPNSHALYWITIVHYARVYQNVSKPFAEVVAPLFTLYGWHFRTLFITLNYRYFDAH
jgi:hypothetical protein